MKKSRIFALACAVLVLSSMSMSFCLVSPVKAAGVTTQLCLILDQTNSLTELDWTLIRNGTADAIRNNMPHDGSVELTVIVFLGYSDLPVRSKVVVPPTVIDGTNYEDVAASIENLPPRPNPPVDQTCTADALYLGWHTMVSSSNFTLPGVRHVINLATDGEPNVRNFNATHDWDSSGIIDYWDDVIDVVMNMTDGTGITELDIEGIAITDAARNWFSTWVVRPQPGIIAPPFTKPGWIRVVASTEDFKLAIAEKFEVILGSPPELTIEKTGPAIAQPNQTFTYSITITNIGGSNATTVVLNDTLPALVAYRGSNPIGTTNDPTHTVQWSLPDIAPAGSVVVQLTVQVDPSALDGDILTNFANVSWYDYPGIHTVQ